LNKYKKYLSAPIFFGTVLAGQKLTASNISSGTLTVSRGGIGTTTLISLHNY
jgi:hypothetical protein